MDVVDYASRLAELEHQELHSDEPPSEKLYTQLLALYVLTDDLTSGKLLWMRIPAGVKADNEDLHTIWTIAVNLIKRTPSPIFFLIREREWPVYVATIMSRIADQVRQQQIALIRNAYSDIRISHLSRLTGCSSDEEAVALAGELGWTVDPESQTVIPSGGGKSPSGSDEDRDLSQEQLNRLTEYVAFLENH